MVLLVKSEGWPVVAKSPVNVPPLISSSSPTPSSVSGVDPPLNVSLIVLGGGVGGVIAWESEMNQLIIP